MSFTPHTAMYSVTALIRRQPSGVAHQSVWRVFLYLGVLFTADFLAHVSACSRQYAIGTHADGTRSRLISIWLYPRKTCRSLGLIWASHKLIRDSEASEILGWVLSPDECFTRGCTYRVKRAPGCVPKRGAVWNCNDSIGTKTFRCNNAIITGSDLTIFNQPDVCHNFVAPILTLFENLAVNWCHIEAALFNDLDISHQEILWCCLHTPSPSSVCARLRKEVDSELFSAMAAKAIARSWFEHEIQFLVGKGLQYEISR